MRLQQHVGVVVDQAGQDGGMAEIDDAGAGGSGNIGADLRDAVAFDQDVLVGEDLAGADVDEFASLDEDFFLRCGGLGLTAAAALGA